MNILRPRTSNPAVEHSTGAAASGATHALLHRSAAGTEDAWRDLHRRYYPLVRRFGASMGVERQELPDFCQEVFIQMFRYLDTFKGRAAFATWLYRICLSEVGRLRRRKRVTAALQMICARDRPAGAVPLEGPWTDSAVRSAERAIAGLKPHLREVFVMFEIEGLDGLQIATILRCPAGTVRRRLHQARQEIETALLGEAGKKA